SGIGGTPSNGGMPGGGSGAAGGVDSGGSGGEPPSYPSGCGDGCSHSYDIGQWCALGTSYPNGECFQCPVGWTDCDGPSPELVDEPGPHGCEHYGLSCP